MQLLEGRRLTGPSLLAREPLVVVELALEATELAAARAEFLVQVARMRSALGLTPEVTLRVRVHHGGAVFAHAAARDTMLACVEICEWAAASASDVLLGAAEHPLEPRQSEIAAMLERDRNPRLLALEAEAARRGIPFLCDDETTSLGHGARSLSFETQAVPASESIDWERLGSVPIALVTGTNGKTTSSRLLAHVAREAGFVVGTTSTDGVVVGTELVERGDWTGPIAARRVLREPRVELAVLETARGGILRRGLAVDTCEVTLITNIAADHLGDYGIDDLDAMAQAKGVTAYAATGTVVLNARVPQLVRLAAEVRSSVVLFADLDGADDPTRAAIAAHLDAGQAVVLASEGGLVVTGGPAKTAGKNQHELLRLADVPITFGGVARYNVENVLGVVAAARGLGIADDVIVRALCSFTHADNPGRGQLHQIAGVSVLLDFGHNPDGVRAVLQLVRSLREKNPGKLFVLAASPGDRSDADIEAVVRELAELSPHRVIVRELHDYLRGRELGAVPGIYRRVLAELGFAGEIFELAESEVDSLDRALSQAVPGDLVVMLVHMDQDAVRARLLA